MCSINASSSSSYGSRDLAVHRVNHHRRWERIAPQQGRLRDAAAVLHLTEQRIRNRLLALEQKIGVVLYHKQRGPQRRSPLTHCGELFLPHALAFLERARHLSELFVGQAGPREIHVAAMQYLILYKLIDAVRR